MFLGQAGMFLSFQARRSSATRSSTSDVTVEKSGEENNNTNSTSKRVGAREQEPNRTNRTNRREKRGEESKEQRTEPKEDRRRENKIEPERIE